MLLPKKAAALAAGFVAALSVATLAQDARRARAGRAAETLVVDELATVDWIEKSDVAALREGVIERMELQIGMPVEKGGAIGYLHNEIAELTVDEGRARRPRASAAEREGQGPEGAGPAGRRHATSGSTSASPACVSKEEIAKAEAEVEGRRRDGQRGRASSSELDKAELDLAEQALDEHTIMRPVRRRSSSSGSRTPARASGPTRRSSELGNLDQLRAWRLRPARVRLPGQGGPGRRDPAPARAGRAATSCRSSRSGSGARSPSSTRRSSRVAETAVRIYAEFENPDHELSPA